MYIRGGIKKFVHCCYNFLMTNDIKMIFGDLLIWCISSPGVKFYHDALSITKLRTFHTWEHTRKQSCSYE